MIHPRLFARERTKRLVSKAAKTIVPPQAPAIDCTIADFARGGACLEVYGRIALPSRVRIALGRNNKEVPRRLEIRKSDRRRFLEIGFPQWLRGHSLSSPR